MKARNITRKLFTIVITVTFISLSLFVFNLYSQEKKDEKDAKATEENEVYKGWRTKDYRPYVKSVEALKVLSKEYAEKNLQLAVNEYNRGIDILEDMESEVLKLKSKESQTKHLNERWQWQEIDRKNQLKRQITRLKYQAKKNSVTNFIKAINYMDHIAEHNKKFISDNKDFKKFKIKVYQVYVSTQYDLHNFRQCIPILENYITIDAITQNDQWAYRYLASCYGFMEKVLDKYKHATEDEILDYKYKKNRSLLKAVELKYTVDSPEYKRLKDIVGRDEMKSEALNDFK